MRYARRHARDVYREPIMPKPTSIELGQVVLDAMAAYTSKHQTVLDAASYILWTDAMLDAVRENRPFCYHDPWPSSPCVGR